jgi:hypothetical protein
MMRRCVFCEELRLPQWLSLFFFVFCFFLLLVALIAVLWQNNTLKAYFLLASVGMGMLCSTAILIIFHSSADSRTFSLLARESVVSPSAK